MKHEVNEWPEYLAYQTTAYILINFKKKFKRYETMRITFNHAFSVMTKVKQICFLLDLLVKK